MNTHQPFYFLVPEEKPHWADGLMPWLLLSALLVAAFLVWFVHASSHRSLHLAGPRKEHKTFQIMPEPLSPTRPLARPRVAPVQPVPQPAPHHRITQTVPIRPAVPSRAHPEVPHQPKARAQHPAPHRGIQPLPAAPAQRAQESGAGRHLPHIDLGHLEEQIAQAAGQATTSPALPKFHNPKGPVAGFYIAGWIQKLERIGDLNYPGDLVGHLKVRVVLNRQGNLEKIIMVKSSGNAALDAAAKRIIRLSFPYTPFSKQLRKETSRIEIPLDMHFLGVRHVRAI